MGMPGFSAVEGQVGTGKKGAGVPWISGTWNSR
jgi:hypothetical protein